MFDLGEEGETPFISMEYVRGEDLKSLINTVTRDVLFQAEIA